MTISNKPSSNQDFKLFLYKRAKPIYPRHPNRGISSRYHSSLNDYEDWKRDNPSASEEQRKLMAYELGI